MSFIRTISILLRIKKNWKQRNTSLKEYKESKNILKTIPPNGKKERKVLIIKTEDIGDYLLFRNCLPIYNHFYKSKNYSITLLGNIVWRDVFDTYDSGFVDDTLWIDKCKYLYDIEYTSDLFLSIRTAGYEIAICAERWRTLAYSDSLVIASDAMVKYACKNTDRHKDINTLSNSFYDQLFIHSWKDIHEFDYNKTFAKWITGLDVYPSLPSVPIAPIESRNKIILNIAGSKKSKRWPLNHWIELIHYLKIHYPNYNLYLIGGKMELKIAKTICLNTGIESMVNRLTITETIRFLNDAKLLITNDSFALHAAVGLSTEKIIAIVNGNNDFRFSDYSKLTNKVSLLYPRYYTKSKAKCTFSNMRKWFYDASSKDIGTIGVNVVIECIKELKILFK